MTRTLAVAPHAGWVCMVCSARICTGVHAPHRGTAARAADANPRHLPLRVYIEVKESGQLQVGGGSWARRWRLAAGAAPCSC